MYRYSFVIPSYNNLSGLKHCLDALLQLDNPTRIAYEIIVVDDGSTDETYNYIRATYPYSFVKCLRLKRDFRSSRARARNSGVREALGEIVNFLDSDIIASKKHLIQLERFYLSDINFVLSGNRSFFSGTQIDKKCSDDFRYQIYIHQSFNVGAIRYPWATTYSCNLSISKANFLMLSGFDENFIYWGLEDLELGYRAEMAGLKICFNSHLQVAHAGCDNRHELMSESERLRRYTQNISYFIEKHKLKNQYPAEDIHELLIRGDALCQDLIIENRDNILVIESGDEPQVQENVDAALKKGKIVALLDFELDSNLDIWVCQHPLTNRILYFPMNIIEDKDKKQLMSRLNSET